MKRILFITKNMACGGVERTLLNLLSSLDRDMYDVNLLLLEKSGEFLELVPDNVRVLEADMPPKWRMMLTCNDQGVREGFSRICKERKYGAAFYFLLLKLMDRLPTERKRVPALYRACLGKIKLPDDHYDIVCDYHGYGHMTTYLASKFEHAKRFSWIHIEKIDDAFRRMRSVYTQFDAFFGVSPECLMNFGREFPEIPSEQLALLYNIILKAQIRTLAQKRPSVEYDTENRFIMVSVGRLSFQKGFDLAVDAANILKKRGHRFLWIFVGEGPERAKLESLIAAYQLQDDVVLRGGDNNPYSYMAMADLYVQTSRYEGFATTLSEAVVLEKPIISTSFSGVDQQVVEGSNGFLSAFDKEDLADKLEKMMENEKLRRDCGRACAQIILPTDQTMGTLDKWFQ